MKNIKNKIALLGILILAFSACKKDTSNQPTLSYKNANATLTTTSTAAIVIDSTALALNSSVTSFSWDSVKLGFSYAATYALEFDVPSDNFANPQSLPVSGYTASVLAVTLNNFCNQMSLDTALHITFGANNTISVRLKVTLVQENIGQGSILAAPVYSNIVALTVNPKYVPVPYKYIWVVGDYMGWAWNPPGTPNKADSLASVLSNSYYEGFVNFPAGGTYQFKLCGDYTWNDAFANAGTTIPTTGFVTTIPINTTPGTNNNLQVPTSGYYYLEADTLATAPAYVKATLVNSFSLLGSATGNAAVPLTFSAATGTWTASGVSLSSGTFEFVINNGDVSQVNFGGTNVVGYVANIATANNATPITVTGGTYNVVLNMSTPGSYTYTLTH